MNKTAIIIGAGPGGLTAAYELLNRTDITPIVIEKSEYLGGISRTINYKGNRIDIGGHRFFSKSDKVMDWWMNILPLQDIQEGQTITYHKQTRNVEAPKAGVDPSKEDKVMLLRGRKSRVYFLRKFFDYPIAMSMDTLTKLGAVRSVRIVLSYLKSVMFPIKNEKNLEQFFINRFGKELYLTFFKSYTEKVWGISCKDISAEWGAQRIKGLSIGKAISHFLTKSFKKKDISQKGTETSLIEQFLYPKYGPGQMWETVAKEVASKGGSVETRYEVNKINVEKNKIISVEATNKATGKTKTFEGDYFISTMPIKDLVRALDTGVPKEIKEISEGLVYRDFLTVGLLLKDLKIKDKTEKGKRFAKDNWIYIQEPDVKVGRLQIFNNWSPYMVKNPDTVWVGMEYFCNETDDLWKKPDKDMIKFAAEELHKIDIIDKSDVVDATVIRMEKTYPAYFGSYDRFGELREYIDGFENLFLIGRNGMHKYNNQDHAMLTAITAVDNIIAGRKDKSNIWEVNTEKEYHEEKTS